MTGKTPERQGVCKYLYPRNQAVGGTRTSPKALMGCKLFVP